MSFDLKISEKVKICREKFDVKVKIRIWVRFGIRFKIFLVLLQDLSLD